MSTQVPGLDNNTPQFSQNVPGVQFPFRQEFGREGAAFEHLGENIEGAAREGAAVYDEVQRQHDIATASNAATRASVEHSQLRENIQLQSPDGFVRDPETGEVVKDRGAARTIAQEYWQQADQSYQSYQQDMSPRAAAIFREKMQPMIAANTQKLQMEGMRLQAQNTELNIQNIKDTHSRDFERSFLPDENQYYTAAQPDGSTKEYPSAQKLYDALHDTMLTRQQMGPVQGKSGFYGATEVEALKKGDANELANNWLTSAKQDLMQSSGSRAALHNKLKDASSTSLMQIHSLLDMVNGKDLQSQRRASVGLPTVNSSLSPENIHRWNNDLLAMIPAAKEVDKHEYELQKSQLDDLAKGSKSLDEFFGSPLFQKTAIAGAGLGITPAERVKDLSPAVSSAILSAATAQTTGINSPEAKRQAVAHVLQDAQKRWPQLAQMLGEKNTEGFGEAITAEASKQVAAKLQEDERQMREDPVKYMAGVQEGPQGPNGTPKYKSAMAHQIENKLDQSVDPSLMSIFKPMGNGKSVMENAQETASNGYARMFGSKASVSILQKSQFEDQAKRIVNSNDPRQITSYFKQLDQQNMTAAQKENYIQDLVHKGNLPQTYADALNLATPAEREARWATLRSGAPELPSDLTDKQVQQFSNEENKSLFAFLDVKYGPNSDTARTARNTYSKSWQDDFKQAVGRGMSESQAKAYASGMRDKTTGAIGIVGAQHDIFGMHFGHVGPQVPVEFGSNKYSPEQQQSIRDTLLHAQSKETLSQYQFVTPPGALPKNENAPSDAEHIAATASFWRRVGGGWRLQVQQVDKENRPTGISQDVQVIGHDGKPHAYEVKETDALSGPPPGAKRAVAPPAVPGLTNRMQSSAGPKL